MKINRNKKEKYLKSSVVGKPPDLVINSLELRSGTLYTILKNQDQKVLTHDIYEQYSDKFLWYYEKLESTNPTAKFVQMINTKCIKEVVINKKDILKSLQTTLDKPKQIETKNKLSKKKKRISLINDINLSTKPQACYIPVKKIKFKESEIRIKVGKKILSVSCTGSDPIMNELIIRDYVSKSKILAKVSRDNIIVSNEERERLVKEMNEILSGLPLEELQKIQSHIQKVGQIKLKHKQIERELLKEKINKRRKEIDNELLLIKKKVSEIEKLVNKKKTPTKSKLRPVNKHIKNKNTSNYATSNNWSLIDFQNNSVFYDKKRFYASKSNVYLNHLKEFFKNKGFTYKIIYEGDRPAHIDIPDKIYDLVKFAQWRYNTTKVIVNGNIENLSTTLTDLKVSFKDLLDYFQIDKRYYLEILFRNQISNFPIICVPEHVFINDSISNNQLSFIFILKGRNGLVAVWESVEINKATYLFNMGFDEFWSQQVMKNIEGFLMSDQPKKRMTLRQNGKALINGVYQIKSINHSYEGTDVGWKNRVISLIGNMEI